MVIFIFSFNGISSQIEGKEYDKIKDALSKFYSRNKEINPNNKFLLYKGSTISNYDLTFNELASSDDKERKAMNILIVEINGTSIIEDGNSIIKSKEIICPQYMKFAKLALKIIQ